MKLIDKRILDLTTEKAKSSPRLRMNHNFHDRLDDPLNRLINAIEPDSYLRPHRHINAGKTEIFLLLRGKAALFLFDDEGNITEQVVLDPLSGVYGGEIEPEVWHTLIILETGSVVYEVKTGPFTPLAPDEFASWSPAVEDVPAAQEYMNKLKSKIA